MSDDILTNDREELMFEIDEWTSPPALTSDQLADLNVRWRAVEHAKRDLTRRSSIDQQHDLDRSKVIIWMQDDLLLATLKALGATFVNVERR